MYLGCIFTYQLNETTMKTATEKIEIILTTLKIEELKAFLSTCPDSLTEFVMNEIDKRMTEEEFIQFSNEF